MSRKYLSLAEWDKECKIAKEKSKKRQHIRNELLKNGDLPYSFSYKIRNAFRGKKCPICNTTMGISIKDECGLYFRTPSPSIQHNIPLSLGGKNSLDNISVICQKCNSSISNRKITPKLNNDEVRKVWKEING